ncbi:SDR family NAD(P)-dependent oxidoreductase [Aquibacillus halophilus]|uniref:SDR family NAD(P)-dependent oxidoreductase n=1 Tax=Aquibacillus halophilus TaxID=930132 RepID=A0A6A8DAY2_9BACI|nr:SDR family oxidoreductase [Aquibacillus halophilus]MRH42674.1 SDR family NAD(P)-dependent oxidoreductase [Aquibacillus halophilus]
MNILITGANRGLGLSLVKHGIENGHHVYAGTRTIDGNTIGDLKKLQQEYQEQLKIVQIDVTDEDTVKDALQQIKQTTKHLDVIINNAGILNERDKSIEELDLDECMKALDINTLGPVRVTKHFLSLLEQGEKQSIINISSEAGSLTNAYSGDYPYGLSKVALNMLTEKLHATLKDKAIQVLSVHPGWMNTDMGGSNAPTDPTTTADGIYQMIERKVKIKSDYLFVDYNGNAMEI